MSLITINADSCQALDGFVFGCSGSVSADCATQKIVDPCGSQSTFGTAGLYYSFTEPVANPELINRIDVTVVFRTTGSGIVAVAAIMNLQGLAAVQLSGGVSLFGVVDPIPPDTTAPWSYIIPTQLSANGAVFGNTRTIWSGEAGASPSLSDIRVEIMAPYSEDSGGSGSMVLEVLEVSAQLSLSAEPPSPLPPPPDANTGDCGDLQRFPGAIPIISSLVVQPLPSEIPNLSPPVVQPLPSQIPGAACTGKHWPVPRIAYDDGTGIQNLTFVYQPIKVPAFVYEAVRHDNFSSAGVRETIFERLDKFLDLDMDLVVADADLAAWEQFMSYALRGGEFDFYQDSNGTRFTTCLLEDQNWTSAYRSPGYYSFKVKFRQRVPWPFSAATPAAGSGGAGVTVLGVSPGTGSTGTLLTVTGTGFQSGAQVTIGTSVVFSNFLSSTQLQVIAPAQNIGTYDVTVTNPDGTTSTLASGFTFVAGGGVVISPTITAVVPNAGVPGNAVRIDGTGFQVGATVSFG